MIKLQGPVKCEVRESPGKGFGVFAIDFLKEGELIEECHLIDLPIPECLPSILDDYRFNYPQGLPNENTSQVLPLGYGCIYNHSNNANAYWQDHPEYKAFQFIAKRNILIGEEICTYYGNVEFN